MFSVLYNKLFFDDRDEENKVLIILSWTAVILTFIVVPLIGCVMLEEGTRDTYPQVSWMMLQLFPVAVALCFIPLYDNIIRWTIGFITTGDIDKPYVIGSFIFGENYTADRFLVGTDYFGRRHDLTTRLGAIITLLVFPLQLLVLTLAFPVVIPYVVSVLTVVGLAFALLLGARKTYTLSKTLRNHINDPNAHKRNDDA